MTPPLAAAGPTVASPRVVIACPQCCAAYERGATVCCRDGSRLERYETDPLIGRRVGRYQVEALIGTGAMARVYRARHARMSRCFALKVMTGPLAADPVMRARFAREAEAASRMSHPNLVPVLDVGETSAGLPYLAMELVDGENLEVRLARGGALAVGDVVDILRGVLRGLAHAHERGLVHRDLKPANVLLSSADGVVVPRLADFGIAIAPHAEGDRITVGRVVFGTPEYMAPEQAMAGGELDHRADLFALGVTGYEMLAGTLPFAGSALEVLRQNMAAPPPPIARRSPQVRVPHGLETFVRRLMAREPDDRFASARAALVALEQVDLSAPPSPSTEELEL